MHVLAGDGDGAPFRLLLNKQKLLPSALEIRTVADGVRFLVMNYALYARKAWLGRCRIAAVIAFGMGRVARFALPAVMSA